jgi:hypothetical protein
MSRPICEVCNDTGVVDSDEGPCAMCDQEIPVTCPACSSSKNIGLSCIDLDIDAPLRSLRALRPDISHARHGAARVPPVSDVAVIMAERSGDRIQVSTLRAYAEALGYELVLSVREKPR